MSLEKASSLSQMLTEMKCSAFNTFIIIGRLHLPRSPRRVPVAHTHTQSLTVTATRIHVDLRYIVMYKTISPTHSFSWV